MATLGPDVSLHVHDKAGLLSHRENFPDAVHPYNGILVIHLLIHLVHLATVGNLDHFFLSLLVDQMNSVALLCKLVA